MIRKGKSARFGDKTSGGRMVAKGGREKSKRVLVRWKGKCRWLSSKLGWHDVSEAAGAQEAKRPLETMRVEIRAGRSVG